MAGRPLGKRHQEDVRAKIQASQIINRLNSAFNGELELSQIQVNIGKTLLDKALPDLKAIEHTGAGENGEHLVDVTHGLSEQVTTILNDIIGK